MKLNPLHNQVGGHDGVLSMGEENEIIVKPALLQELKFYEEAFLHPELQAWMPAYYGTLTLNRQLPENGLAGEVALVPTIKALSGFAIQDLLSSDQIPSAAAFSGEGQEQEQTVIKEDGNDECICLENISHGFKKPCVLDLKMGTQLYDDDATDEKKARLGAVANNTTTSTLGLRLTGFTVYDNEKEDFTKYSRHYGKGLTNETVLDGFRCFFAANLGPKRMRLVLERFVNDLADFLEMIETQELRMRSSSLLLVYEGDAEAFDEGLMMEQRRIVEVVSRAKAHLESNIEKETGDEDNEDVDDDDEDEEDDEDDEDDEDEEISQKVTDMRLIDFGHSTWTPGMGPDEGVVLGVKSALSLFERLIEEDYPAQDEEDH